MEITKFNFIVAVIADDGQLLKIYVPQPSEVELKSLAPLLGQIFTEMQKEGVSPLVLMKDWEVILDKVEEQNSSIRARISTFFERSLLSASIYTEEGEKREKLSDSEADVFKGSLLFISALYRYSTRAVITNPAMKEYFTSSTASGFQNLLKNSSSQGKREIGVRGR